MKPRILIICPSFPPNPGIGGRRWAKFAKTLFKQGCDVWVFSFKLPNRNENSHWTKDVEELLKNNRIIEVDRNYPAVLDEYPKSFIDKLKYKFWDNFLKFRYKGNTYDRSLRWGVKLTVEIEKKINNHPIKIIATGAPFRYLSELICLNKYSNVSLIADFRDPWVNNEIAYNKGLSKKKLEQEKKNEQKVISEFNKIFCVDQFHIEYFKSTYNLNEEKFILIPNGFDPEEAVIKRSLNSSVDRIRIVFAGTLYADAQYIVQEFASFLEFIKANDFNKYSIFELVFYGNISDDYKDILAKHEIIQIRKEIALHKVQYEIANADFIMVFLTNQLNYTFNTKVLESINQGKKVLVFSSPGYLENFVVEHNIGYSMTPLNMSNSFNQIIKDKTGSNYLIGKMPIELMKFDINHITKRIIKSIK